MGIESDQLVYDYLSRVGDLAQTTLSAAGRRELVARLRQDIDRQRRDGDSPAAVRRILGRLGSPDEVVEAAARPQEPGPSVPVGDGSGGTGGRSGGAFGAGGPRGSGGPQGSGGPDAGGEPEWWRVPGPRTGSSAGRTNGVLAGWTGGLEIPDVDFEKGAGGEREEPGKAAEREKAEPAVEEAAAASRGPRRRLRLGRRAGTAGAPAPAAPAAAVAVPRRRGLPVGPLELLAALALVAGVLLGSLLPLIVGWLLAYGSRGLSRAEAKFAALGVPGLAAAGMLVWLWGRMAGRWGQPIANGQLGPALSAGLPMMVRVAAIGSALFLLWRGSRRAR